MSRRGDNIHKRKDGRWEGRYGDGYKSNGSIKYVSVYAQTYTECKNKLLKAKQDLTHKVVSLNQEKNFSEILFSWLSANRMRLKGATEAKYLYLINNHIVPGLGKVKISRISADVINSFLNEKLQKGGIKRKDPLSPTYVRTMAIIIEAAINYAAMEGQCERLRSPINKPCIPKRNIVPLNKHSETLLTKLLIEDKTHVSVGVLLALQAGLRIGEVCALKWEDIDFEANLIRIRHTIARVPSSNLTQKTMLIIDTPKTNSSIREIPMPSILRNKLLLTRQDCCSKYVISQTQSFIGTRTFDYQYRKFLQRNGFQVFNFHSLRHTYATRCAQSGVDAKTLSFLLGHASSNTSLNVYVHPSIELAKKLLDIAFS